MKKTKSLLNIEFEKEGSIFMGAKRTTNNCNIGIYSVPYDGTTSFRPGARFGPSSIRESSQGLETYCPQLTQELEQISFADLGSLIIPYNTPEEVINIVKQATKKIFSSGIKPLMLGGEHSITSGAIAAIAGYQKDMILIQLDAHADLRKEWLGSIYSHACTIRRCLEILPSKQIFQIGIRSGTKEEFQELKSQKRLIPHVHGQSATNLEKALIPHLGKPIYLTIDLDWFDPSVLPGTGTPEPGGYFWQDFAAIIDVLKKHQIIGADVVELAPQLDPSGNSSILAAKVTRSLLMLLNLSKPIGT